ncbi:MAG TPA: lamin tail domain-containing protein, partial [Acidimicrobiia bacterium]|nr:lamin tail domain-containing protein [Acidimicrobiia bacterium]
MIRTYASRLAAFVAFTMVTSLVLVMPATPAQSANTDLIISEYIEGSSFNKAIEIYNGTGAEVDLSTYVLELYSNGSATPSQALTLSGTLADGDVLVLANPSADQAILDVADVLDNTVINFNGDDALALHDNGTVVDSFGQVGFDPGSEWPGGGADDTLRRKAEVTSGDTDSTDAFDASLEWDSFPVNTFDGLGSYDTPPPPPVTGVFFSEYIEGSSSNKAIEIYNGSGAELDLSTFTLELYSNGAATASQSVALSGTLAAGDVFVAAHGSADPAILAVADLISNAVINFNGDDAVVLRSNGTVVDAFGQIGFDPGSQWPGGGADDTLRRKDSVTTGDTDATDPFDASVEWDSFAVNTFDGLGFHGTPPPAGAVINEFSASTAGTDVEYVEVYGPPSTDLSHLTILEIEGDGAGSGVVDEVIPVGTTDAAGFWLADLPANTLENGTITLLLVSDFAGSLGEDLDADNDGVFDTTPWGDIVDAVAVNDGGAGDLTYGEPVLVALYDGLSFAPGGASRIPDGTDTDTVDDWVRNDFDLAGIGTNPGTPETGEAYNTPGAPNQAVEGPPPPPPIGVCYDPATFIHEVQGSGLVSPMVGQTVTIEGIVVGDFQNNDEPDNGNLNGFHVQEEDADVDADLTTSEGIFVYAPGADDVSLGDQVRVLGPVSEFNGLSEITLVAMIVCSSGNDLPTAATPTLPVDSPDDFEAYEGMRVVFEQDLAISEFFNFDRYGEIVLSTERQFQPTAVYEPGSPEAAALADFNERSRITLDDGRTAENPDPA